jgi:glycerophosphoryl diester phosphodiesterase
MSKHVLTTAAVFAALAVIVPLCRSSFSAKTPIVTKHPNLDIIKIGHRGSTRFAPENTVPAYNKAIEFGFDYAEVDVRFTKDGVPVIMHDDNVSRTTDGTGLISGMTIEEIKKLDAGVKFGKEKKFKGTKVPTFEEALQTMQGHIKIYIDQKEPPRPIVLELLKKYGFYPDRVLIVGANERQTEFLKLDPNAPVMPNVEKASEIPELLKQFPLAIAFNVESPNLTPEIVEAAHAAGVMVFANTLLWADQPTEMRRALQLGVDAIQSDDPPTLLKILDRMKKESEAKK